MDELTRNYQQPPPPERHIASIGQRVTAIRTKQSKLYFFLDPFFREEAFFADEEPALGIRKGPFPKYELPGY
ncbi:MAG: hypothetical protein V6Z81_09575 [Parvularculales bacterium]